MSIVYRKDSEKGTWIEQPAMPRKRPRGGLFLLGLLAILIISLAARRLTPVHRLAFVPAPPVFNVALAPHSLKDAMSLYKERGGHYIWGHNDCSTFVLDYLVGHGIKSAERQTTETLIRPAVAERMHLIPMDEVTLRKPVPQSVVVMRYVGHHNEMVGHCAVRLVQNGEVFFVHNSASDGLVCETEKQFYGRFDLASIRDVRYYRFESGF
jgi:hypothetical protein